MYFLKITAEAVTPLSLDPYCGSAIRGAFFHAIWQRFCTHREAPTCSDCSLVSVCPVASLVAPLRDEAIRGRDIPRPYIITPPYNPRGRYGQGETFSFSITLIGDAAKLYPYVMRSLLEMERSTLGHPLPELKQQRGKFRIQSIHAYHPFTEEKQLLWQKGDNQPDKLWLSITANDVIKRAEQLSNYHVNIHFLSPTRLVAEEHILKRPDFRILILRLAQRLEQVYHEYGSNAQAEVAIPLFGQEWYLAIKDQAKDVYLVQDETQWVDIRSYSQRQKRQMPIGGFVGRASFAGNINPFRELLVWGEVLRVGKNVVKGDGAYCIEL